MDKVSGFPKLNLASPNSNLRVFTHCSQQTTAFAFTNYPKSTVASVFKVKQMQKATKSINIKKLVTVLLFVIPLIADLLIPGSGIFIEIAFLIWELLEPEETEGNDLK
ncbi:hypothetical protein VF04_05525 [Nostoc linckia z7]|uniref:Uncharacterized protein n=3 Tax=Nostoc linckia TaxID=92942 RepID=A0A9Q6EK93_NOSLI|nr:hypothetical protein VF02_22345 [Nostoc linckia z1]PHJ63992.1 hypothetical protein VF05_23315 [Nostoc linckia z3]PHJ76393.1 hypothetical protein VF03_07880 [Nostoc linckia z2]PHJ83157.1 hypothetical protein VF06_13645 [Nostoc linckia z4]PHJ90210.1 hypothetical protein VF07_09780 [Nostoc linckia z6]PHJ99639.1 hypothetical protein VF04_05525 [Nostoc linckia z7]PHK02130.1 hypothetical protein VF08_19830 [Nostoc linckia z8]PHK20806.1 hypothetical protein VF11_10640 [Nostoc linckia z14]PHK219